MLIITKIKQKKCIVDSNFRSPGYGLSLVAETTNDYHIASELSIEANDVRENGGMVPEDFSRKVCLQLLDEVYYVIEYDLLIYSAEL